MLIGVTKIVTVFLPFALPNDVMFKKSDDSAHLSYRFDYFVKKKTKNSNVDINLSTTEHAFTESFKQCICDTVVNMAL